MEVADMTPPIILSRRELYDLVWSKPMRDVAADLGISDVGLSKVCERHRVPRPEQGYWNKKSAGKKVKQTLFVETDDPSVNRVEVRGGLSQVPEAARQVIEKARAARKTVEQRRDQPAPAPVEPVAEPHKAISRTAKVLRKGSPDRNGGVRAFGEGLCGVNVAAARVERTISFLDGLARALEKNGLALVARGQAMGVTSGADEAVFTLKERTRQEKHSPTGAELAAEEQRQKKLARTYGTVSPWLSSLDGRSYPEFDTIYTGEFVFQIEGYSDGVRRKWADGKTQTVERLLGDIVVGIIALLAARKEGREKSEARQREWKEMERRRALAKRRSEREEKRLTYIRSVFELSEEADRLRDWLDREEIKNAGGVGDDFVRLVAWARARLSTLEATTDPHNLNEDLKAKKLFPETDDLADPLGELSDESPYWWRGFKTAREMEWLGRPNDPRQADPGSRQGRTDGIDRPFQKRRDRVPNAPCLRGPILGPIQGIQGVSWGMQVSVNQSLMPLASPPFP
jgi:hypothetical protein